MNTVSTDFYAKNETYFDNVASILCNSITIYENDRGTYVFESKFIGEQLAYANTFVATHYSFLIVFNCIYENITLVESGFLFYTN